MTNQEGRRVLVEATEVDCPYGSAINAPYVSFQRGSGGTTTLHVNPSIVHAAPPEWAQPWPDGVWLATVAEVRERGLWWAGRPWLGDIADNPDDLAAWCREEPDFSAGRSHVVLAREPIPPHRTVSFTLPADATDQAARDEASRVWREAVDQ